MRITELNHVSLPVADLGHSTRFYEDVLGLESIARPAFDFPGSWFRLGPGQELHLICRGAVGGAAPADRHFALMVDDAAAFASHLAEAGVEHTGPKARPDGAQQIFLRDPDGHVIELCTPPG